MNELEIFYIRKYDTYNNGYNLTEGGTYNMDEKSIKKNSDSQKEYLKHNVNSFYGKHHTDEAKAKISKANSIPVLQLDKNTNEIINEFSSIAEAERYFGTKQGYSTIVYICKNKKKQGKTLRTWKGYKWVYKNDYKK